VLNNIGFSFTREFCVRCDRQRIVAKAVAEGGGTLYTGDTTLGLVSVAAYHVALVEVLATVCEQRATLHLNVGRQWHQPATYVILSSQHLLGGISFF
jgi:hypothetical protein